MKKFDELPSIAQDVWDMKYRLKTEDGTAVDESVEATWRRVAKAAADAEESEKRTHWEARFFSLLEKRQLSESGDGLL